MVDEAKIDQEKHNLDNIDSKPYTEEDYLTVAPACEELGNLLGICAETCDRLEKQVLSHDGPAHIPVLEVIIGFSKEDAARRLGASPGGRKFLALVCALVTAFDLSECVNVVSKLLTRLVWGDLQLPTPEQLSPFMSLIVDVCHLSGFAEYIVNYEIMVSQGLRDRRHKAASALLGRLGKTPNVEAVVKLVELLSLLCPDDSEDYKLKTFSVNTGRCAPWVAALLRWWLNKEPTIYLEEGQSEPLEKFNRGETPIGIKLTFPDASSSSSSSSSPSSSSSSGQETTEYVVIRAFYSERHWEQWSFPLGSAKHYGGLVKISTFFQLMLNAFKLDRGQANKAAVEVIPYAVWEARKSLTMCSEGCVAHERWGAPCLTTTDMADAKSELWRLQQQRQKPKDAPASDPPLSVRSNRFEPFPERPDINKVLRFVAGCEGKHMQDLRSKQMGLKIHEHRDIAAFLGQKKHKAAREAWAQGFKSQFPLAEPGPRTIFEEQVAHVVATVLALSLFRDPEMLMVRPDPFVWQSEDLAPSTVISAICRAFRKQASCCDVTEWHRVCRRLAGEEQQKRRGEGDEGDEGSSRGERSSTIVSCGSGQAVWPAITFDWRFPNEGESYLRLFWCRGKVLERRTGRWYDCMTGRDTRVKPRDIPRSVFEIPSRLTASDISPDQTWFRFGLQPHPSDGRILQCSMVRFLDRDGTGYSGEGADPMGVLRTLASAERLDSCPHDPNEPMDISAPVDMDIDTNKDTDKDTDAGTDINMDDDTKIDTDTDVQIDTDASASEIKSTVVAETLPDVYLCAPEDALPWLWDWARRANDEEVGRQGLTELLEHARCTGDRPGIMALVPAAGDQRLRLISLAKPVGAHVAIRGEACVSCCVRFCKKFGFDVLVL